MVGKPDWKEKRRDGLRAKCNQVGRPLKEEGKEVIKTREDGGEVGNPLNVAGGRETDSRGVVTLVIFPLQMYLLRTSRVRLTSRSGMLGMSKVPRYVGR